MATWPTGSDSVVSPPVLWRFPKRGLTGEPSDVVGRPDAVLGFSSGIGGGRGHDSEVRRPCELRRCSFPLGELGVTGEKSAAAVGDCTSTESRRFLPSPKNPRFSFRGEAIGESVAYLLSRKEPWSPDVVPLVCPFVVGTTAELFSISFEDLTRGGDEGPSVSLASSSSSVESPSSSPTVRGIPLTGRSPEGSSGTSSSSSESAKRERNVGNRSPSSSSLESS